MKQIGVGRSVEALAVASGHHPRSDAARAERIHHTERYHRAHCLEEGRRMFEALRAQGLRIGEEE